VKSWKAELMLFSATFIWGATFIFTKVGLDDCPPSLFVIIRFCIALLLSLAFFGKHLKSIDRVIFKRGAILGLLFGGGFLLQTYGLSYTTVSKSAFITGMTVPITPFVFYLIQRKPIQLWSKIGVGVSSIGLYIFTDPSLDNINLGDFLTLLSTFFWAFYITLMDKYTKTNRGFNLTAAYVVMQFIAATPLAVVSFFILDFGDIYFNPTKDLFIALAFNGILASFFVTFIHTGVQKYTTPVKAALIFSLEPVIAGFIAALTLSEYLNIREYIGASIMMTGLFISEIGGFFEKRRKEN
jgi:drug/metabolite transporter (DMT)-like permease